MHHPSLDIQQLSPVCMFERAAGD